MYRYSPQLVIGDRTSFSRRVTIYCAGKMEIGKNCMFAGEVLITNENHGTDPTHQYRDNPLSVKSISIGDNVWVGEKAMILPGANTGSNSIIGAGAVVKDTIPPYCIAVGVPAKVVKVFNQDHKEWNSCELL